MFWVRKAFGAFSMRRLNILLYVSSKDRAWFLWCKQQQDQINDDGVGGGGGVAIYLRSSLCLVKRLNFYTRSKCLRIQNVAIGLYGTVFDCQVGVAF